MRLWPRVAAFLILLFSNATAFGQERDLQLAASIVGERYCAVSAEVNALQLTLHLRYTNAGNRKLILYRGDRLFYQIFVSRTREDAAARSYELRTSHARYYDERPEKIEGASPGGVFIMLSPGASYETRQVIIVPVACDGVSRFNRSLGAGEHVLHVAASTWYESKKLAQDLRERWKRAGFLWADPVASNSVSFVVDANRQSVVCR